MHIFYLQMHGSYLGSGPKCLKSLFSIARSRTDRKIPVKSIMHICYELISASTGRANMFSKGAALLEHSYYHLYYGTSDAI